MFKLNQIVILCGGFGTRLKNISKGVPKSLISIHNTNFIEILLKNLSRHNFKEAILLCHYKGLKFYKKYHNKYINGLLIKCIIEKKAEGTLKSLVKSKKKFDNFFLLSNGDTFFDINVTDLYHKFDYKNNLILMAANKVFSVDKLRYQNFLVKKSKLKKVYYSKKINQIINTGLCIVNKKVLNNIDEKYTSFDKELLKLLIPKKKIQVEIYKKNFVDIGVPKDLKYFQKNFQKFTKRPAIFLDRDGVINFDYGYVYKKKDFIWKKNVIKAIKYLNDRNFFVFIISNQSGIGRGYYSIKNVEILHNWMKNILKKNGAFIDDIFYAPYYKDSKKKIFKKGKILRKPNIGMINLAKKKWNIDMKKSFIIGDSIVDKKLARNVKLKYLPVYKDSNLLKIVQKNCKQSI